MQKLGHEPELGDVADDLVQRAVVAELELGRVELLVLLVAAGVGAAAGADLADAEGERLAAQVGGLARAQDHAGVRHGEAQDGDELAEVDVADRPAAGRSAMSEPLAGSRRGTLTVCGPTPYALSSSRMCCSMARISKRQSDEAEEHADADVVDAGLHGAVHAGDAPVEVLLLAADVHGGGTSRGGTSPGRAGTCRCRVPLRSRNCSTVSGATLTLTRRISPLPRLTS